MKKGTVIIYTDGACSPNPGRGGWGAVLVSPGHGNHQREISGMEPESTNNRMELTAAVEALRTLKRPCAVELHTDSAYVQKAFTEGWLKKWQRNGWMTAAKKPVKNEDLWRALLTEAERHEITWKWVKGHAEDPLNERADELAVEARSRS